MARLTKGTTVTPATTVTSQTLHDLIELATLSDVTVNDITGAHFVAVSTSTPNASTSPFWYDPSPEDPIFRVFATPFNMWLAVGPDRYEIPLLNSSGTECFKGALVVASGASNFSIGTAPSINAIGFLQSRTAAGSYGPVAVCGIGWMLYASSVSITSPAGGLPLPKYAVTGYGCPPGTVAGFSINEQEGSGPMFGMWLESNRSGASGSYSPKRGLIWGPRITQGF